MQMLFRMDLTDQFPDEYKDDHNLNKLTYMIAPIIFAASGYLNGIVTYYLPTLSNIQYFYEPLTKYFNAEIKLRFLNFIMEFSSKNKL